MSALEQLLESGQVAKAKTAAEQALAKQPQDRSALVVLSKALLMEGQLDQAEQYIARAEKLGSTSETLLTRGNLAAQRGQLEPAAGYFRQAIGRRLRMKVTPTLRFEIDRVFEQASRVENLLRELAPHPEVEVAGEGEGEGRKDGDEDEDEDEDEADGTRPG